MVLIYELIYMINIYDYLVVLSMMNVPGIIYLVYTITGTLRSTIHLIGVHDNHPII